jgi:hypothetical protein
VLPPDPVDYLTLLGEYTGGFAKGSAEWFSGTLSGIWWLISSVPGFVADYNTPVLLWQSIEYMARVWESLGPTEKDQFFDRIASGIVLQTKESYEIVRQGIDAQVSSYFDRLVASFYGGEPRQTAFMLGEISGQVSLEAATWYLQEAKAGTLIRELATDAKLGTHLGDLLADGVRRLGGTWPLDSAQIRRLWAVTDRAVENLGRLAKEKKLLISIRARSAESLRWIEEFRAVFKPEKIKIKNVSEIDTKWLGYADSDLGRVIVKEDLLSEVELAQRLTNAGLDATKPEWIAAFQRRALRAKELTSDAEGYVKYLKARAEKGRLDVGFNYRDNFPAGTAQELPTVRDFRNFSMPPIEGRPGSFEVLLEDTGGVLRPVTGDIDIVAITKADGSFLTVEERLEIYRILQDMPDVNAVHPESATWIAAGDATRWQVLSDHFPGTPKDDGLLLQFGPDAVARPAYLDPNLSYIDEVTGQTKIYYQGGYKTPKAEPMPAGAVEFVQPPTSTTHGAYVPPFAPGAPKDCDPQFSTDPAAQMIRVSDDGGYERYVPGQGWQPITPAAAACPTGTPATQNVRTQTDKAAASGAPVLLILPQTALTRSAGPGDHVLEIANPLDYAPELFPNGLPAWFAPGQHVIVNPGGPNEEIVTVASLGSLHLTSALQHAHEAGEMVSVMPTAQEEPNTPPPTTPDTSTGPGTIDTPHDLEVGGQLAFTGTSSTPILAIAISLLTGGLLLILLASARRRHGPERSRRV